MDVWFGFKYANFLKSPLPLGCIEACGQGGYCPLLYLIRIPHQLYTISVFSLHCVTFCKERVYSPCGFLIRESLDIG